MTCRSAIILLEQELESLGHGTSRAPRAGTVDWYLVRAKALGLSALRRMEALGIADDPAAVERLYKSLVREGKEEVAGE